MQPSAQVQLGVGNVQDAEDRRGLMRQMWRDRIRGVQRKVEVPTRIGD